MMDPRDTPGYRLHRALSNLNSIDIEQLDSPDRERVVEATTLLEQVGLLTRPGTSEKANTKGRILRKGSVEQHRFSLSLNRFCWNPLTLSTALFSRLQQ